MDDLPELPFQLVLSHLSLQDRLRARSVSRSWREKFDFKLNNLCLLACRYRFIFCRKSRWVNGARNLMSSPRFVSFFDIFGCSILSNLKRLRLCHLSLVTLDGIKFFHKLNSFGQLQELGVFDFGGYPRTEFELNLPMLTSLQLEEVRSIEKLTLDSRRLRTIRVGNCDRLKLVIVHGDSVERLLTYRSENTKVKSMKNLHCLYVENCNGIDPTLLSDLEQLKKFHTMNPKVCKKLFEQKQRYSRDNLKIYLGGLHLNGPEDPAIRSEFVEFNEETLIQLGENPSRLADEIPFHDFLPYSPFEAVAAEVAIDLVSRFTDLSRFTVDRPVQNIERFLDLHKNFPNIATLKFWCDQPQELFDRLPECSAVQWLNIRGTILSFEFLCKLKKLVELDLGCSIGAELVRKLFTELPSLSRLVFKHNNLRPAIELIDPKQFRVTPDSEYGWRCSSLPDLEAVIQFIFVPIPIPQDDQLP